MKLICVQNTKNPVYEARLAPHLEAAIAAHAASRNVTPQGRAHLIPQSTNIRQYETRDGKRIVPPTVQNRMHSPNGVVVRHVNPNRPIDKTSPSYWKLPTRSKENFTPEEQSLLADRRPTYRGRDARLRRFETPLFPVKKVKGADGEMHSYPDRDAEKTTYRIGEIPDTIAKPKDVDLKVSPLEHADERIIGRDITMPETLNPTKGKILEVATYDNKTPFSYTTRQPYTGETRPAGTNPDAKLDLCVTFFADTTGKEAFIKSTWLTPSDAQDRFQFRRSV